MVDAQAVDLAVGGERQRERVRRLERGIVFHAQGSQIVDVEKAPVVDLVRGHAPVGQPKRLQLEQGMQGLCRLGGDACDPNNDNDGCTNVQELGLIPTLGGQRDPLNPWDFFDVPVPPLLPGSTTGVRNKIISLSDVLADLAYVGTTAAMPGSPNANGAKYGSDLNGNGIADGVEYDRTPSTMPLQPWRSGPPNGVVSLSDVLVVLTQVGTVCM